MHFRPSRLIAGLTVLTSCVTTVGCGGDDQASTTSPPPLLVGAASDLRPAFTELGKRYAQQTGQRVTFTYGASGQLAKQLANGAPYALFASASIDYVDEVLDAGRGDRSTRAIYAYGRLAVWSPERRYELDDLTAPSVRTIAIADPDHAPYGKAAVEALRAAGLHARVKPKLVYGDNVAAALQLARSGNADAAIVARALALSSGGHLTGVPQELHQPIAQGLVVTGTGDDAEAARAFVDLLQSDAGQEVLRRDGFILPGDASSTTTPPAG